MSEIPVAQLGELLAGPGNHEGKAILTLGMEHGVEYGYTDLWRLVDGRTEESGVHRSGPVAWCQQSLEPSGVVERTSVSPRRFALTDSVGDYGQSLAGLLLPFGDQHNKPLSILWGERESNGTIRSPLARFLIVSCLLDARAPMTPSQVDGGIGIGADLIAAQAGMMQSGGLAIHKPWDRSAQDVRFRLARREHQAHANANISTVHAVAYLREHGSATLTELEGFCWSALPEHAQAATAPERFRYRLNHALNTMARRGIVAREEGRTLEGSISLTDEQRAIWSDLIIQLEAFAEGDKAILKAYKAQGGFYRPAGSREARTCKSSQHAERKGRQPTAAVDRTGNHNILDPAVIGSGNNRHCLAATATGYAQDGAGCTTATRSGWYGYAAAP